MGAISEEVREELDVSFCKMADFRTALTERLKLITGVAEITDPELLEMTEDERYKTIMFPMLVIGQPGMGKTEVIMSVIKEINDLYFSDQPEKQLGYIRVHLGDKSIGAMEGVPVPDGEGGATTAYLEDLPVIPRDNEYGVLFLDEITTCDEQQVQPAMGLADSGRNIGAYKLPPHWFLLAAGNGPENQNFIQLTEATVSRFSLFYVDMDFDTWKDYAFTHHVNNSVIAYLEQYHEGEAGVGNRLIVPCESEINKWNDPFPTGRSWERVSRLWALWRNSHPGKRITPAQLHKLAGREIGDKAAGDFAAWYACLDNMKYSLKKILEGTEVDPSPDVKEEQVYQIIIEIQSYLLNSVDKLGLFDPEDIPTRIKTDEEFKSVFVQACNAAAWVLKWDGVNTDVAINCVLDLVGARREQKSETAKLSSDVAFDKLSALMTSDALANKVSGWDEFIELHSEAIAEENNMSW